MRPIDADALAKTIIGLPITVEDAYLKLPREVMREALDQCLKAILNAPTVNEWISVKERLPKENTKAIVITEDKQMLVASYTSFGWMYPCYGEEPTHWVPLPEPPEVEG